MSFKSWLNEGTTPSSCTPRWFVYGAYSILLVGVTSPLWGFLIAMLFF